MKWLTKQEWKVIGVIVMLLATGWLVKKYRAAHPPAAIAVKVQP